MKKLGSSKPEELYVKAIPTGLPSLDKLKVLKEGRSELVIVAGRPGMGKSSLMFQIARHMAETNRPVHVFSLEMNLKSIETRMLAGDLNVSTGAIEDGRLDPKVLGRSLEKLRSMPYYIDDRGGLNMYQIMDAARLVKRAHNTQAIVIDHLHIVTPESGHSTNAEISKISANFRALAKELDVPIILGCQLNRGSESRGNYGNGSFRPRMSDLRDSGTLEQDADIVILVHRESVYDKGNPEWAGKAEIIVAKNRSGPVDTVIMDYSETQTRFIDRGWDI